MKTKLHLYLFLTFMFAFNVISPAFIVAQKVKFPAIVPAPVSLLQAKGHFKLSEKTKIVVDTDSKDARDIAVYFTEQLKTLTGMQLSVSESMEKVDNSIIFKLNYNSPKKEAYSLSITEKEMVLNGSGPAGLFYGVQTFFQLIDPKISLKSKISVPCVEIKDEPVFVWRGMHLDVSRHFFSVEFVKKMIDRMAQLKLNTFHWHLTDDQGWRIEIKKYPKLTDISAWRDETMVGHYTETGQKFDGIRYGGYYTQEQIKDVVKYAQSRFITIVPEIEMPGHAVAVLSAYPEYSCTGGPFKVYTKWGVSEDVFCAGKEGTFELLENILDEVANLFPGQYIHIGGDECPKTRWKACPDCQKRIKDNGLKDELELQSYFVKRIENFIASKGKKLIGWDEILEGGLPERATVMSWRGYKGGIEAAHYGHDVVMTPTDFCYFDYYQGKESEEPLSIGGFLPLEKVYSFNPVPPQLSADQRKHILGAQANLWTEYITTEEHLEYMVFPRICAMAEILWTPKELQNYPDFLNRIPTYLLRLKKANVNYRPLK